MHMAPDFDRKPVLAVAGAVAPPIRVLIARKGQRIGRVPSHVARPRSMLRARPTFQMLADDRIDLMDRLGVQAIDGMGDLYAPVPVVGEIGNRCFQGMVAEILTGPAGLFCSLPAQCFFQEPVVIRRKFSEGQRRARWDGSTHLGDCIRRHSRANPAPACGLRSSQ